MQVCELVGPVIGLSFKSVNALKGIRYINGEDGGGAGAATTDAGNESAAAGTGGDAGAESGGEVDYKAKYEESLKHSREWEQRAKGNKQKADAFDAAEAEKLTEIEKERKRAETAEGAASKSAAELLQLRAANTHGITADERPLLTATDDDELSKQVASILKLRAGSAAPEGKVASAKDAGITGGGKAAQTRAKSLAEAVSARINQND